MRNRKCKTSYLPFNSSGKGLKMSSFESVVLGLYHHSGGYCSSEILKPSNLVVGGGSRVSSAIQMLPEWLDVWVCGKLKAKLHPRCLCLRLQHEGIFYSRWLWRLWNEGGNRIVHRWGDGALQDEHALGWVYWIIKLTSGSPCFEQPCSRWVCEFSKHSCTYHPEAT